VRCRDVKMYMSSHDCQFTGREIDLMSAARNAPRRMMCSIRDFKLCVTKF
jgi:hypothetical protein